MTASYVEFCQQHSNIAVDPYWIWAELSGFEHFALYEDTLPIIYEKAASISNQFVTLLHQSQPLNQIYQSNYGTALVNKADLGKLFEAMANGQLIRVQLCAARNSQNDVKHLGSGAGGLESDSTVNVAGIIDTDFALFHENLRPKADAQPSVLAYWDQSTPESNLPKQYWTRLPNGANYGIETSSPQLRLAMDTIKGQLPRYQHSGADFETACYKEIKLPLAPMLPRAHGTSVWHICCGPNPFSLQRLGMKTGGNNVYPAVLVQLPKASVIDTSGGSLARYALDGLRYVYLKARGYAGTSELNLVTNISFGSIGGPHDGTTILERAIDEICRPIYPPRLTDSTLTALSLDPTEITEQMTSHKVVLAGGNTSKKDIHASANLLPRVGSAKNAVRFSIEVRSNNDRETYVEFWLKPSESLGVITVVVTDPDEKRTRFQITQSTQFVAIGKAGALVWARHPCLTEPSSKKSLLLMALTPTQSEGRRAKAGIWQVSLMASEAVEVHAWIERNDGPVNTGRKQMARFVHVDNSNSTINDSINLSHIANGAYTIAAGACLYYRPEMSPYSASEARWSAQVTKHLTYAAADISHWQRGVTVPGTLSGTWTQMSGTSVAAPFVTRHFLDNGKHSKIEKNIFELTEIVENA
jgi:hypothetical protein